MIQNQSRAPVTAAEARGSDEATDTLLADPHAAEHRRGSFTAMTAHQTSTIARTPLPPTRHARTARPGGAVEGERSLRLRRMCGFGGNTLLWHPGAGLFAYGCQGMLLAEHLAHKPTVTSAEPRLQTMVSAHVQPIELSAVSADGALIATASAGVVLGGDDSRAGEQTAGTLRVHSVRAALGAAAGPLSGEMWSDRLAGCSVQALAFDPSSRLLLGVTELETVVWEARTGSALASVGCGMGMSAPMAMGMQAQRQPQCVAWVSTDAFLAVGDDGRHLRLWSVTPAVAGGGHNEAVGGEVSLSFVTLHVPLWQLTESARISALAIERSAEDTASLESAAHVGLVMLSVALGSSDGRVCIAECPVPVSAAPGSDCAGVGLGSGGTHRGVRIGSPAPGQELKVLASWQALGDNDTVRHIAWGAAPRSGKTRRRRLVAAGDSADLRLCRLSQSLVASASLETATESLRVDSPIGAMAWCAGAEEGVVGTRAGTIWYVNWRQKALVRLVSSHIAPVSALASSVDGAFVISVGSSDGSLRVWEAAEMQQVMHFQAAPGQCTCVAVAAAAQAGGGSQHAEELPAAAGYSDGTLRFFNLADVAVEGRCYPFHSLMLSDSAARHGFASNPGADGDGPPLSAVAFLGGGGVVVVGSTLGHLVARVLPPAVASVGALALGKLRDAVAIATKSLAHGGTGASEPAEAGRVTGAGFIKLNPQWVPLLVPAAGSSNADGVAHAVVSLSVSGGDAMLFAAAHADGGVMVWRAKLLARGGVVTVRAQVLSSLSTATLLRSAALAPPGGEVAVAAATAAMETGRMRVVVALASLHPSLLLIAAPAAVAGAAPHLVTYCLRTHRIINAWPLALPLPSGLATERDARPHEATPVQICAMATLQDSSHVALATPQGEVLVVDYEQGVECGRGRCPGGGVQSLLLLAQPGRAHRRAQNVQVVVGADRTITSFDVRALS